MISEWLTSLTTPCAKPFRAMGYLHELIAIGARHRRCRRAWAPHLEACRELIENAAANVEAKGKVVVLGSGHLLDIPLAFLASNFNEVVLVDICHLRNTRKLQKTFPNLHFVEADISGVVDQFSERLSGDLPEPEIGKTIFEGADYVISSNLLAQLPIAPLLKLRGFDQDVQDSFARSIIDNHLALLQNLNCPVTLITETMRLFSDDGQTLGKTDPLYGAPLNYEGEEWWWDLAPRPEISRDYDLRLLVKGIANLNDADYARFCRNTTLAAP